MYFLCGDVRQNEDLMVMDSNENVVMERRFMEGSKLFVDWQIYIELI